MPLFDSHAHYEDGAFAADREDVLRLAHAAGVTRILTVGSDLPSSEAACALAQSISDRNDLPAIYAAIGIHPLFLPVSPRDTDSAPQLLSQTLRETADRLRALAALLRVVAIGEIGLDYRRKKETPESIPLQKDFFDLQLSLCEELDLPAVVHSVGAAADTLDLLRAHPRACGVLHGFSYAPELARIGIRLGRHIGIGTAITNPQARRIRETTRDIPMDALLVETDSPFRPPHGLPGQRNTSAMLPAIIEEIARLRQASAEEIARVSTENACRLFRIR